MYFISLSDVVLKVGGHFQVFNHLTWVIPLRFPAEDLELSTRLDQHCLVVFEINSLQVLLDARHSQSWKHRVIKSSDPDVCSKT
jgi:hypothetical protein